MLVKEKIYHKGVAYWCVPANVKNIVFVHKKSDLPKNGAYPVRVARWWEHPDKIFSWGWSQSVQPMPKMLIEIDLVTSKT